MLPSLARLATPTVRVATRKSGPAHPYFFWFVVGSASYYAANTAVNVYVDERDFRKAVADEKRAAWAETAAGQAQLAELAAADARASEAEEQRQLRLMETDHGREELAQARRIKVADLRHREMKLLYDLARTRDKMDDARRALAEDQQAEATRRAAREASAADGGAGAAGVGGRPFGFGWAV